MADEKKTPSSIDIDPKAMLTAVGHFIGHHGAIIFIVLSLGLLGYSIYTVKDLLSSTYPVSGDDSGSTLSTKFDETTIADIKKLKTAKQTIDLSLPPGRINPFAE